MTAKRTLLTSLLETTSLAYPTQTAFSSQLAELYGASFGMNVNKRGNLHQINAAMSFVNGSTCQMKQYCRKQPLFSRSFVPSECPRGTV